MNESASSEILKLDNQICFALYAANRAVTARYRPILDELGVTYPQYLVMLVLWEHARQGQVTHVSDLGRRLRLDSGTLTPLLKRLSERGLLSRSRDPGDERSVIISLTDAGLALENKAREVPARLLCDLNLPPERLGALRDELRAVLEMLEASSAPNAQSSP
ncbi:MAG: MarR family transcriptional regulator [Marinobacter sp.]|nr:MarR family transcriptional regulator [Marinobacter sp.]